MVQTQTEARKPGRPPKAAPAPAPAPEVDFDTLLMGSESTDDIEGADEAPAVATTDKQQLPEVLTEEPSAPELPAAPVVASTGVEHVPTDLSKPRVVVVRALKGERQHEHGEVIEIAGQRQRALVNDRRIRFLQYGEELYRCRCGLLWVGESRAEAHCS